MSKANKHIGSTFESFLEAEGLEEEVYTKITKTEMARRRETSRAQLDRLLDPAKREGPARHDRKSS